MWVATAVVAASAVISYVGSKKAASAARDQSREEARLEKIVTDERLRQIDVKERVMFGETLAAYAGSGVLGMMPSLKQENVMSGSPQKVIQEQKKELQFERDVTSEAGASRVQQALMGGKATSDMYRYSGYANLASGISSMFTTYKTMTGP